MDQVKKYKSLEEAYNNIIDYWNKKGEEIEKLTNYISTMTYKKPEWVELSRIL